jgi:hypothetical protein
MVKFIADDEDTSLQVLLLCKPPQLTNHQISFLGASRLISPPKPHSCHLAKKSRAKPNFPRDTGYLEPLLPIQFKHPIPMERPLVSQPGSKIIIDTFLVLTWHPHVPFSLLKNQQQIKVPVKEFFAKFMSSTFRLDTQTL